MVPNSQMSLCGLKVDVIVAGGAGAVTAAKNASATTPIVMAQVNDPIMLGLVASLADPGGNITGISNLSPELSGKRLELIKVRRQESRAGSNFLFSTICRESHLLLPHVSFSFIRTAKSKTKERTVAAFPPRHFATSLSL